MENAPPEDQLVLSSFLGELHQGEVEIAHNSELLFLTSNFHLQVTCARTMCCKQDRSNLSNKFAVLPASEGTPIASRWSVMIVVFFLLLKTSPPAGMVCNLQLVQ
jgi:hypothetical protein